MILELLTQLECTHPVKKKLKLKKPTSLTATFTGVYGILVRLNYEAHLVRFESVLTPSVLPRKYIGMTNTN